MSRIVRSVETETRKCGCGRSPSFRIVVSGAERRYAVFCDWCGAETEAHDSPEAAALAWNLAEIKLLISFGVPAATEAGSGVQV
jgi:hypothetical protein